MIIDFIIALALYDVVKFIGGIVIVVLSRGKADEELEIQKQVKTFEERIREKMEQNKN